MFALILPAALVLTAPLVQSSGDAPSKPQQEAVRQEMKQLQGEWHATSVRLAGHDVLKDGEKMRMVITGERLRMFVTAKDAEEKLIGESIIALDPRKSPKAIDMTMRVDGIAKTSPGIYALEKEELRLCFTTPIEGLGAPKGRPQEFNAERGVLQMLSVFRRAEKK